MNNKPLIILTAGGTGGHVFPAESLAEELSARGYELALITDSRGKDNYHGKLGEIKNYSVLAGALVGKSKWFKIKSLFKTGIGTLQAMLILLRRKPVCVVGFGGYASFPCCMAAILLRKKLVIHEQNSVMSRTNRILSRFATLVAKSFDNTKYIPSGKPQILTGMPIRQNIAELNKREYKATNPQNKFQLLVIGGSQGAKIFGEVIPAAVKKLPEQIQEKICLFHQCRKEDVAQIQSEYEGSKIEVTVSHFFENMSELYSRTSLIISRAGASSMAEITAAKLPAIIVPLPTAADDHQTTNALPLKEHNAGYVIAQNDFNADDLCSLLQKLITDEQALKTLSENVNKLSIINASQRLADVVETNVIKGE